jgi:hypothetical protein
MRTTLRKLTVTWPLVIFLLHPALARAETAVQAWVQAYNGMTNLYAAAHTVAVDSSNNVIVAGESYDGSYYLSTTIKYSSAGVPLWTNQHNFRGSGNSYASAVAVDGSDNVLVTGQANTPAHAEYATVKYSSAGVALWTNFYYGPRGADDARAVAVDGNNDVVVTGVSTGGGLDPEYATIKYSSAGVPLWTNRYNGGMGQHAINQVSAVAVDRGNNVIVTGGSENCYFNMDYATIKYSSAGVPLWTNRYNGPANYTDLAYGVAVDGNNNVIVTGYAGGSEGWLGYATIKYSSAGVPVWTNRYDEQGLSGDLAYVVAVDGNNDVVVAGFLANNGDYATIKYSSAGVPLWTNRWSVGGVENFPDYGPPAFGLAVDGSNNVIVTSSSTGTASGYDYATIKYSSAGVLLWTKFYNGPGNLDDHAQAMTLDHSGNVIVTGYSYNGTSDSDFVTVKYICGSWPVLTCLQPTNGTFQLRVDDVLQPGTLVIEASTDLAGWAPVFTNTTPTNVLYYIDPAAGTGSARFYRAFQFP